MMLQVVPLLLLLVHYVVVTFATVEVTETCAGVGVPSCGDAKRGGPHLPHPPGGPHLTSPLHYLHIPKTGSSFGAILLCYGCERETLVRIITEKGKKMPRFMEPIMLLTLAMRATDKQWYSFCLKEAFADSNNPDLYTRVGGNASARLPTGLRLGHPPLSEKARKATAGNLVMMLRDPLDRTVSAFLHNFHDCRSMQEKYGVRENEKKGTMRVIQGGKGEYKDKEATQKRTTELLLDYARCVDGIAIKMMVPDVDMAEYLRPSQAQIEEAVHMTRTEFAFIGLTERWEETACLFRRKFGGTYVPDIFYNSRPAAGGGVTTSEGLREGLREVLVANNFTDADQRVYDAGKHIFEQALAAPCGAT